MLFNVDVSIDAVKVKLTTIGCCGRNLTYIVLGFAGAHPFASHPALWGDAVKVRFIAIGGYGRN